MPQRPPEVSSEVLVILLGFTICCHYALVFGSTAAIFFLKLRLFSLHTRREPLLNGFLVSFWGKPCSIFFNMAVLLSGTGAFCKISNVLGFCNYFRLFSLFQVLSSALVVQSGWASTDGWAWPRSQNTWWTEVHEVFTCQGHTGTSKGPNSAQSVVCWLLFQGSKT